MIKSFDENATADDVLGTTRLDGKRILVTGVSAGLGIETARALAARGATVVGTARDLAKARHATDAVDAAARQGDGTFELVALDLADLASVRSCADAVLQQGKALDVIIANAGVMASPAGRTVDGFETQFGTNHLGHFVFINRLAAAIPAGGRVVSVASAGHRFADVDLDDPNFERTPYAPFVAYGRSKTANVLFAVAFDRRHRHRGIRAAAVHPGGVQTELTRHTDRAAEAELIRSINEKNVAAGLPPFRHKSIPQGAATSVWAAVVADAADVGGRYCEDCHVAEIATSPTLRRGVQPYALDQARADALWTLSEKMVGERF